MLQVENTRVQACTAMLIPLSRLAERFGTPLYVYSGSEILRRIAAFKEVFQAAPHTICYSVKANSNLAILRLLAKQGCGFDIVSGGELERIQRVSPASAAKVVFSGVGKTAEEILAALKTDIFLFNVESESELAVLVACAAKVRRPARVAFRVNPDVPAETHPYIFHRDFANTNLAYPSWRRHACTRRPPNRNGWK